MAQIAPAWESSWLAVWVRSGRSVVLSHGRLDRRRRGLRSAYGLPQSLRPTSTQGLKVGVRLPFERALSCVVVFAGVNASGTWTQAAPAWGSRLWTVM